MHTTLCLKEIVNFERSLFRADRLDFIVGLILFAAFGYAFINGHSWMNKQQQAVHAAQTDADKESDATVARFEQEHPEMTARPATKGDGLCCLQKTRIGTTCSCGEDCAHHGRL